MGVTTVAAGNQCRWVLKIKQQTQSLPTAGAGEGSTELILITVVSTLPEYKSRSLWGLIQPGERREDFLSWCREEPLRQREEHVQSHASSKTRGKLMGQALQGRTGFSLR